MRKILVADDSVFNLVVVRRALEPFFQVYTVESGLSAIDFLQNEKVDMLLLDIEMPGIDGIETFRRMKQDSLLSQIPVIFLTSITDQKVEKICLDLGARDFITKPFNVPVMLQRINMVLELEELRFHLESQVRKKTQELEDLTVQTITTFANSIDAKDSYTKSHSYHVAKYAQQIGIRIGLNQNEIQNLYYTALLHDIGKIGIPDFILNKPGKLTAQEYNIIKKHPEIGGRILADVTVVPSLGIGASTHHEHYDGSGYPLGKKGEGIPLIGRIVGIADAVDAMRSDRAYRPGRGVEETILELERCSGTQFDPYLVSVMSDILREGVGLEDEREKKEKEDGLLMAVISEYARSRQIDPLTGLWNRAYAEEKIELELNGNKKAQGALILLDIDDFGVLNAALGKRECDLCLHHVAEEITASVGCGDIVCRLEEDAFIIFLTSQRSRGEVRNLLQEMMKKMVQWTVKGVNYPLTMSLGVAMVHEDGDDFHTLYCNADKALYHIKHQGKNNLYFYSENAATKAV